MTESDVEIQVPVENPVEKFFRRPRFPLCLQYTAAVPRECVLWQLPSTTARLGVPAYFWAGRMLQN